MMVSGLTPSVQYAVLANPKMNETPGIGMKNSNDNLVTL